MKATFIFADDQPYNTSHYRIFIPAKYLQKAGHEIVLCRHLMLTLDKMSSTVLVERVFADELLQPLRSLGAQRVVLTFDDDYLHIPRNMTGPWNYWKKSGSVKKLLEVIGHVEKTVVPSVELTRLYHAELLRNYLDPELWPIPKEKEMSGSVVIGWGGSLGHLVTWQNPVFAQALADIQRRYPQVKVRVCGAVASDPLHRFGVQFTDRSWKPFEEWPDMVRSFDIGLAPLSGVYDQARSDLKLREYGAAAVPFVASAEGEYRLWKNGGGSLVPNTVSAWVEALARLVEDEALRQEIGWEGRRAAQRDCLMNDEAVRLYEEMLWP